VFVAVEWCTNTYQTSFSAVLAGVICFGDQFTAINGLGVCIVTAGVVLYNIHKYKKLKKGELVAHHGGSRKTVTTEV
jgi:drug/metabolite transporter (DMT)-like permease